MSGQRNAMIELERALGFTIADLDMDIDEQELTELAQAAQQLQRFTVPEPSKASAQRLLATLRPHVSESTGPRFRQKLLQASPPRGYSGLLALIRPQICVLGRPFWVATVVILLLATWLALQSGTNGQLPLLMLAPLTGAIGIVYAFRSMDERVLEVEAASAMTWQQLVLARMVLIIGMNVSVLSAVSLVAWLLIPGLSFSMLLLSWLTPLLVWASIALNVSLRSGHWPAMLVSFATWGLQLLLRLALPAWDLFSMAGSTGDIAIRLAMIVLALATLALAVRGTDSQRDLVSHHLNRS